jgi:hypothetical protein
MSEEQVLVFGVASVFLVVAFIAGKMFDYFKLGAKQNRRPAHRRRVTRLARQ